MIAYYFNILLNYIMYGLSYLIPTTYRTINSFNEMYLRNQNSYLFMQLLTSIHVIIISLYLIIKKHKVEINYYKRYIFNYDNKYKKMNRFFLIGLFLLILNISVRFMNINLFENYDYLIYLLSFMFFIGFLWLYNLIDKINKTKKRKKVVLLSRFDTLIISFLYLIGILLNNINLMFLVILYLIWGNFTKRSISFTILIITLFFSFSNLVINFNSYQYFDIISLLLSLVVPFMFIFIYNIIFNKSAEFRTWFATYSFIATIIFYIIYI